MGTVEERNPSYLKRPLPFLLRKVLLLLLRTVVLSFITPYSGMRSVSRSSWLTDTRSNSISNSNEISNEIQNST